MRITGLGYYLPEQIESSQELTLKIGKSLDWILSRTGIHERRISKIDVDKMGAIAAKKALNNGPPPDLILNASGVPKQTLPDTSTFIQAQLGYEGIPSFSVHATCLSFLTALKIANNFITCGDYKRILIVSSDRGTCGRNFSEPESSSLLGDAAAAVVIEPTNESSESALLHWNMKTWPEGATYTEVRGGGTNKHPQDPNTKDADNLFTMNGPMIYKMARKHVYTMLNDDLMTMGINREDIALLVPHQASGLAVKAYVKYGKFNKEQVMDIISYTGNCVAASLPLALAIGFEENRFKRGDLVYLVGTGAGLSVASTLIKF
jgi:3-oxoacyl-[acyl-carrier-protein] synthase III